MAVHLEGGQFLNEKMLLAQTQFLRLRKHASSHIKKIEVWPFSFVTCNKAICGEEIRPEALVRDMESKSVKGSV